MDSGRFVYNASAAGLALAAGGAGFLPLEEIDGHVQPDVDDFKAYLGNKQSTKQGGYAYMKRVNGANKRARRARRISRLTRNGQHL